MYFINEFNGAYNEEINDFIIDIYVGEYGYEKHRANLKQHDNNIYRKCGGNLWFAADEDNNIVGTIAVFKHSDEEMELKRFYVRKDFRGTGISKELYKKAIEACKKESIKKISLGTFEKFENAIHFYTKRRIQRNSIS